eukprot:scaffold1581_cov169-Amphora_coffeaeformis.AAC.2
METSSIKETTRQCPTCGKLIPGSNYELHSLRCNDETTRPAWMEQMSPRMKSRLWRVALLGPLLVLFVTYSYFFLQWRIVIYRNPAAYVNHPGLNALLLESLGGPTFRRTFLDRMPQSYLPDVWPESSFSWTRVIDDFWMAGIRPPLKDRSSLVAESNVSPEQAWQLKNDLLSMTERLDRLSWKAMPASKGACDGTMCAVHRWNAYTQERVIGRFQCWTDPSLLHQEPKFVRQNPLFHPAFVNVTAFFCLVDVPGFAASLGTPRNLSLLQINNLLWSTETIFDHDVRVREGDLPADVMRRGIQPYFLQFLDVFIEDEPMEELEDEGEVIDLDRMDEL